MGEVAGSNDTFGLKSFLSLNSVKPFRSVKFVITKCKTVDCRKSMWISLFYIHPFHYISVCRMGEYLNMHGGCSNCSVGTYQSADYHRNEACSNCTGAYFTIVSSQLENGIYLCNVILCEDVKGI